jgi:glycosyltransferase involved in cell wall biosynthesis
MKSSPKILHLSASDSGGAYVFAENLITGLQAQNIEANHLVFSGERETFTFTNFKKLDHFIKFSLHAIEKFMQMFYEKDKDVRFKFSMGKPGIPGFMLRSICKEYDIIHLHWINKGFINIKDLASIKKPIVWTCHDLWPVSGGCHLSYTCQNFQKECGNCQFMKNPSARDLSNTLYQEKADLYKNLNLSFVSPSAWMNQNVANSSLGKNHKHLSINNGVDTNVFKYKQHNSDKFVIGFVAANLNDKNKALYRLIDAIKLLPNPNDFKLLLVGNKKHDFEFEIPIAYEHVSNIQSKEAMSEQYQKMDCLVCTSSIETFPTTLMEAYCCGVTGLGFKVGGIPEIIEKMDGQCASAFDVNALSILIQNASSVRSDKQQISEKAKAVFGLEKTASEYLKVYMDLFNNKA